MPHFQLPFIQPDAYVVDTRPGEGFFDGRFHARLVIGELHRSHIPDALDPFPNLLLGGHADDAVVHEEHPALISLVRLLRFCQPRIHRRFRFCHVQSFQRG